MEQPTTYKTKDLSEAAAVYAAGCRLRGLEPNENGRSFYFIFDDLPRCLGVSRRFWSGELILSAKGFADSIRTLKDMLFARR